tara:strand:+ start:69 stop:809 length:741 start_codon:yes stop_codon:yes gene_type:complete
MGEVKSVEIPSNETGPEAPMEGTVESEATQEGQTEEVTTERPEWLPEEFSTPEELAKAYQESTKVNEDQPTENEATSLEFFKEDSVSQYTNEFNETGNLSEESINAITNAGIPREYVEAYLAGQQAMAENQLNSIYNEVGGEDTYNKMTEWAQNTLPDDEINSFNSIVEGSDKNATMLAIRGLFARFNQNNGAVPQLLKGNAGNKNSSNAFRSMAEVTAAMKDPRYRKDEAYRKEIEDRLNVSNIF